VSQVTAGLFLLASSATKAKAKKGIVLGMPNAEGIRVSFFAAGSH
jgi:hypothetical protein